MVLMRHKESFYAFIFLIAVFSSFTIVLTEQAPSKSDESNNQDLSSSDDNSSSQEDDSKEKRSREEIMFGNQQNRPSGLVDDLMGMAENMDEDFNSVNVPDKKSNQTQEAESSAEEGKDEKRNAQNEPQMNQNANDMMMDSGSQNWYENARIAPGALQYLVNSPGIQTYPSEDFSNTLYDQDDLYRRKRQLISQAIPLRKRSLRNSLGQMIQKRGIRMPRRSMRLKRQVDVEDLLSLLNNLDNRERGRLYDESIQVKPENYDRWARKKEKKHVPGRFSTIGYPETSAPEYRYPYMIQDDSEVENEDDDDIDDWLLLPPTSNPNYVGPFRSQEEENAAVRQWLAKHATSNVVRLPPKRSFSYPLDYRYYPGFAKRSNIFSRNRMEGRDEVQDQDFGKWGQVVQVPEAYASGEDVARLYALANLLAEGDDSEAKMRRSI